MKTKFVTVFGVLLLTANLNTAETFENDIFLISLISENIRCILTLTFYIFDKIQYGCLFDHETFVLKCINIKILVAKVNFELSKWLFSNFLVISSKQENMQFSFQFWYLVYILFVKDTYFRISFRQRIPGSHHIWIIGCQIFIVVNFIDDDNYISFIYINMIFR